MRGRTTGVLIASAAAVLVLLVLIQQSLGGHTPPPEIAPRSETATAQEEEASTPSASPTRPRDGTIKLPTPMPERPSAGDSATTESPGAGPAPVLDPVSGKPPPIASKSVLRDQVNATEGLVVDCVQRASRSGAKPTGKAMLTFIVAAKDNKAVIETTGFDHDETTLEDTQLVECMHKTALAMKFENVPGADAVMARHHVELENGKLVANKLVEFSYLRK